MRAKDKKVLFVVGSAIGLGAFWWWKNKPAATVAAVPPPNVNTPSTGGSTSQLVDQHLLLGAAGPQRGAITNVIQQPVAGSALANAIAAGRLSQTAPQTAQLSPNLGLLR